MTLVLVGASVSVVGGCAGRSRGSVQQLVVVQYRYNVDEKNELARVYGLVWNTGQSRTPPADVVITLVGSSGSMKGQDRVEVAALRPGEEREFALELTTHGKTNHVDIQVVPRGAEIAGSSTPTVEDQPADNG